MSVTTRSTAQTPKASKVSSERRSRSPSPIMALAGGPVARQRYTNWSLSHETASQMRYAKLGGLLNALNSIQYLDFHIHSQRNDARAALLAVLADAPFSEVSRFPDAAWIEVSASVCGQLFERCLSSLAFGESGAAATPANGGRDPYSDSKVQFMKSRSELVKKLMSTSANIAAVDGVYQGRAAFERYMGLNWGA